MSEDAKSEWQELHDQANADIFSGDYAKAIISATKSIELAKKAFGTDSYELAKSNSILSMAYFYGGEPEEMAMPAAKQAYAIAEKVKDANASEIIHQYAVLLQGYKHYAEAEKCYLQVVKLREKAGKDNITAKTYGDLGRLYYEQGKMDKVEEAFLKSQKMLDGYLKTEQDKLAPEYSEAMYDHGLVSSNLGLLYKNTSRFDEAVEQYVTYVTSTLLFEKLGGTAQLHMLENVYRSVLHLQSVMKESDPRTDEILDTLEQMMLPQ